MEKFKKSRIYSNLLLDVRLEEDEIFQEFPQLKKKIEGEKRPSVLKIDQGQFGQGRYLIFECIEEYTIILKEIESSE